MPQQPTIELIRDRQMGGRPAIRVTGLSLSPDVIAALDGVAAYQVTAHETLLYPSRARDCETVCQRVEKALGVTRS